jgi:hypothetical protein
MGNMGSQFRNAWVLAIIGAVALVGACGLNPQPIPPGETEDMASDAGTPTNAATGGGGDGSDGSPKSGDDSGAVPPDDAGDASDGSFEDAADSGDT